LFAGGIWKGKMLEVGMALGFGIAYEGITSGGIFGQECHIIKSMEILSCRKESVSRGPIQREIADPAIPPSIESLEIFRSLLNLNSTPYNRVALVLQLCTVYVLLNSPLHIKSSLATPLPLWNMN
jgi:hypothetical protein